MKSLGSLLFFLCLFNSLCFAQHRCNTDAYHALQLEDPAFANAYKEISSKIYNQPMAEINCTTPIMIPIAVHFGGNIDASDPDCLLAKVDEQIRVLNVDFAGINVEIEQYKNLAASCPTNFPISALGEGSCIQFVLATINLPSCEPSGNLLQGKAITIGQHTWPSAPCWAGYLNIFVDDNIQELGIAALAGGSNPNGNGVVIHASAFGGSSSGCNSGVALDNYINYGLGRTGTHEVAHYFGLKHVFDGCMNGDLVNDTPNQSESNLNCPTINQSTCSSSANNTCGTEDFFFNFLDYVDDPCMWMFTEGQNQVMHNTAMIGNFETGSIEGNIQYQINFVDKDSDPVVPPAGTQLLIKSISDSSINIDISNYLIDGFLSYPTSNLAGIDQPYLTLYNNDQSVIGNGLSALDIILIRKHILNLNPFTNPYKILAADVNNNQSVSAVDIISIRKVVLGINSTFPKDVYNFYIQECNDCQDIPLTSTPNVLSNLTFTVVKTGDVN